MNFKRWTIASIMLLVFSLSSSDAMAHESKELHFHEEKNPWTALLFSIVPGGGHFYNGERIKGGLTIAGLMGSAVIMTLGSEDNDAAKAAGLVMWSGIHGWSMLDAFTSARRINKENKYGKRLSVVPVLSPKTTQIRLALRF